MAQPTTPTPRVENTPPALVYNTVEEIDQLVQELRTQTNTQQFRHSLAKRREQLAAFFRMIDENQRAWEEAIWKDVRKGNVECQMVEILPSLREIGGAIKHLDSWTKDTKPSKELTFMTCSLTVRKEPMGMVLLVGPWNYPLRLLAKPLAGALAAGNTVVIKPSEISCHTTALMARLINQYMDPTVVQVVVGGVEETTALLTHRFDHIFFTGSSHVGRVVMRAASEHLTSVTLELGGKSPTLLFPDAHLRISIQRIMWGKFINAGQSCVAPDYLICTQEHLPQVVDTFRQVIEEFYGTEPKSSKDYGRIINVRNFQRLLGLVKSNSACEMPIGKLEQWDESDLYIPPTVLTNVQHSDAIMREEIFGPILPILTMDTAEEMVTFINQFDHPLALYVFSNDRKTIDYVISHTTSGGVCVNDVGLQVESITTPFGGVGPSGIGSYNGQYTFEAFTHDRTVVGNSFVVPFDKVLQLRYPPYEGQGNTWKTRLMNFLLAPRRPSEKKSSAYVTAVKTAVVAAVTAVTAYFLL
ncbi:hypothetical protein IWQ62_001895 [Dispira parvispora]|uniref:Aldehyde dehydrogenase n=1 Tax=Dispira parvispora TaxID=1520584 RepID=A0A9W8ATZ9_9FUNG|nr:hypothetical protein IWQ62_001895 [Dispira parvispora]